MLVLALDTQQCMMAGEKNRWNILCLFCHLQEGSSGKGRFCNMTSSLQIDEKKTVLQTEFLSTMKRMAQDILGSHF